MSPRAGASPGFQIYFDPRTYDLVTQDELEGDSARRVPPALLVLLSPVVGALYAIAFPVVVFGTLLQVARDQLSPHRAGEIVEWGIYVGTNRFALAYVGSSGEVLGGREGTRFVRIPALLVLLGSPALGGVYVVLFPFLLGGVLLAGLASAAVASARWMVRRRPVGAGASPVGGRR